MRRDEIEMEINQIEDELARFCEQQRYEEDQGEYYDTVIEPRERKLEELKSKLEAV